MPILAAKKVVYGNKKLGVTSAHVRDQISRHPHSYRCLRGDYRIWFRLRHVLPIAIANPRIARRFQRYDRHQFDDDADRRAHWDAVFADEAFMAFASEFRPMLLSQENKLLTRAPWGPGV